MKKQYFIFLLLFALLGACKKIDEWTHFTLVVEENTTIDAVPVLPDVPLNIPIPAVPTNSKSVFENNNTNKDLVEEARLTKMTLSVESPANGTFSFMQSVEIYIQADGLPEVLIASKQNVPPEKTIELDVVDRNLVEYVKKDQLEFRVKTVIDEILLETYTIKVRSEFFIDAKILGV